MKRKAHVVMDFVPRSELDAAERRTKILLVTLHEIAAALKSIEDAAEASSGAIGFVSARMRTIIRVMLRKVADGR